MKIGKASGLQIAFFTFAIVILATAAVSYVTKTFNLTDRVVLARAMIFLPTLILFVAITPLRKSATAMLQVGIPAERLRETWIVALGKSLLFGLAVVGGTALWYWFTAGPATLEAWVRGHGQHDQAMAHSLSFVGILSLFFAVALAPLLEELVFRGYLYRAWEERWGWIPAMVASSALFALYHKQIVASFVSALIYAAVFRRTGSLWAPILVHATYNLTIWYPLMGRHLLPDPAQASSALGAWSIQLTAFFLCVGAIGMYLWMARKGYSSKLSVAA